MNMADFVNMVYILNIHSQHVFVQNKKESVSFSLPNAMTYFTFVYCKRCLRCVLFVRERKIHWYMGKRLYRRFISYIP